MKAMKNVLVPVVFSLSMALATHASEVAPVSTVGHVVEDQVVMLFRDIGFPAAAYFLLYWFIRTSLKENTDATKSLTIEITKLRDHCMRGKRGHEEE